LRESATLPVDLNSPKQVKNVKTPDGPLNKSADDTELPEEGLPDSMRFICFTQSFAARG
jgi:hypothetical protein